MTALDAAGVVAAASVIRQSLIPMFAFYLILMVSLGLGLRRVCREAAAGSRAGWPDGDASTRRGAGPAGNPLPDATAEPAHGRPLPDVGTSTEPARGHPTLGEGTSTERAARPGDRPGASGGTLTRRAGWLAFLRHVAATAAGGYFLLMVVAFGYYYAVARVGGNFLSSAVSGPALLLALALPLYVAIAWLLTWRARRSRLRGGAGR
jgi:hypothetical protein